MMSDSQKSEDKSKGAEGEETKGDAAESSEASKDKKPKVSTAMDMTSLSDLMAMHFGLKEKPPCKLDELTLKGIANFLNSDKCKNIVTMVGAGISTSAGIPDFRSPGTGLYDNLASYNLPHPQAIFEIDFFKEQPKPFFVLAKELLPGSFKPTVCHYFLKMLADKGKLRRHFTQNIDTLERVAGMDPERIVEAHGTFHTSHCLECCKLYALPWMEEQILADKIPKCDEKDCDGLVKPDIVFFGESLPPRFIQCVNSSKEEDKKRVKLDTPRLYINLEPGMTTSNPITALMFGGGFEFDAEDNYRDVFKKATCDDGCQELADLLGWGDDLKKLVKSEHERIDKEDKKKRASGPPKASATQSNAKPSSSPTKTKTISQPNLKKKL